MHAGPAAALPLSPRGCHANMIVWPGLPWPQQGATAVSGHPSAYSGPGHQRGPCSVSVWEKLAHRGAIPTAMGSAESPCPTGGWLETSQPGSALGTSLLTSNPPPAEKALAPEPRDPGLSTLWTLSRDQGHLSVSESLHVQLEVCCWSLCGKPWLAHSLSHTHRMPVRSPALAHTCACMPSSMPGGHHAWWLGRAHSLG